MKIEVEEQYFDEDVDEWSKRTKSLNMPDELPGKVGDKADRKLDAKIDMNRKANNGRDSNENVEATTSISSSQFQEVTDYLAKTMMTKYNRGDEVDMDKVTDESKKKVARHYFDQLNPFGMQKKSS